MGLNILVESIEKGIPTLIIISALFVIWQLISSYARDRSEEKKFEFNKNLENKKFEHRQKIERLRFAYEQLRWREQLSLQLSMKLVDARLAEYSALWSKLRAVVRYNFKAGDLTPAITQHLAGEVEAWRYSTGGILADNTTRKVVLELQTALWHYDGSKEAYSRIETARNNSRAALRADMGIEDDPFGKTFYDRIEKGLDIAAKLSAVRGSIDEKLIPNSK
jgi:hypothetical protein